MKLMHLSDLHIGKRLNEVNLIEDQAYILDRVIEIAREIRPDGILIAGDVYDKAVPPADAVKLFDQFLSQIALMQIPCFVISGNHDSSERIAFGGSIMAHRNVHMSKVFDGDIQAIQLADDYGDVTIYMMPFIKPIHVKQINPEAEVESYQQAIAHVIQNLQVDPSKRNVLMMHQFITAIGTEVERCDSESISIGGTDNIDYSILEAFDYVALGHLHKPHRIGRDTVRYSGSPLKYSFSEVQHQKSVTVITLNQKGQTHLETVPLIPRRELRKIKGHMADLLAPENYKDTNIEDYIHVTLTDEDEILDAIGRMRQVYPNVMMIEFENSRTKVNISRTSAENLHEKTDLELFSEFYEMQNNEPLSEEKLSIIQTLLEKIGGHLS